MEAYALQKQWLCRVKADYIHFGVEEDADKRDVEGKIVQNFYVNPKVGTWGGGEWACNSMFYSLEHHVIVDLMGGQCKLDAEEKVLRIPFYQFLAEEEGLHDEAWQLQQWEKEMGMCGVYRYYKFRGRHYKPADWSLTLMICRRRAGWAPQAIM